ncbi:MAG: DNA cytosine methyltransferase [Armatimonadetes bacterium]|nr:DNA cytosine methyltransferase [Armatimonadota bacterium]
MELREPDGERDPCAFGAAVCAQDLRPAPSPILLIEDDSERAFREPTHDRDALRPGITLSAHLITDGRAKTLGSLGLRTDGTRRDARQMAALTLLERFARVERDLVVAAGTRYGDLRLIDAVHQRGFRFVLLVPRSHSLVRATAEARLPSRGTSHLVDLLKATAWRTVAVDHPISGRAMDYQIADLGPVEIAPGIPGRLVVSQTGGIHGLNPGTLIALASKEGVRDADLVRAIAWTRWIWPVTRRDERAARNGPAGAGEGQATLQGPQLARAMAGRPNIAIMRHQDEITARDAAACPAEDARRRVLAQARNELTVAELFAGAGGMGLGFLLARQRGSLYRLLVSAEVEPIYVQTLAFSHAAFASLEGQRHASAVPKDAGPLDLRSERAMQVVASRVRDAGGLDVLIGGPPCQGFSSANRNTWHSGNPNNKLVDVYLQYVAALRPRVFLMENVQGILWTPPHEATYEHVSVVDSLACQMADLGYTVFPKVLDAVWYGVPQHRNRFFVLGLSRDLGYGREDFGDWGPFPRPTHGPGTGQAYVTVRDAIADLPEVANGRLVDECPYVGPAEADLARNAFLAAMRASAPSGTITDHVTSRHAAYVIERYKLVPPGGNWEDIVEHLTNYADAERTHSSIYRRLRYDEPAITIGHYRKSMLIHPDQHRGLSLREASRLQSFPDWFRFAGGAVGTAGGLSHKQQQLANAVCPLVTAAVAEYVFGI